MLFSFLSLNIVYFLLNYYTINYHTLTKQNWENFRIHTAWHPITYNDIKIATTRLMKREKGKRSCYLVYCEHMYNNVYVKTDGKITKYKFSSSISKRIGRRREAIDIYAYKGQWCYWYYVAFPGIRTWKRWNFDKTSSSFSSCHTTQEKEHEENMNVCVTAIYNTIRAESVQFSTFLLVSKLALVNEHQRKRHIACYLNLVKRLRGIHIYQFTGNVCNGKSILENCAYSLYYARDIKIYSSIEA